MTPPSVKFDSVKLRWDLLPFDAVAGTVSVLTHGAQKYSPNGWQSLPDARNRYFAALMRHLAAYQVDELIDPESGLPHLDHAAANLLFLQWFARH
jgi:hypothetical protein